jgi:hypothetical protein
MADKEKIRMTETKKLTAPPQVDGVLKAFNK